MERVVISIDVTITSQSPPFYIIRTRNYMGKRWVGDEITHSDADNWTGANG
jgi:hypothetical protein